ncbi:MAG: nucleotide exchange factor GrpE [Clostridia bacterium]|nr:nucleotide exchange factor GrpE [Clostridia bacterium]
MAKEKKTKHVTEEEKINDNEQSINADEKEAIENSAETSKDDAGSKEIDTLKAEIERLKDAHMRCAAEYANYRTRTDKEKTEIYTNATIDAIKNILPIADSIDIAIAASANASEEYKKGLELIKAQLDKSFEALGVESYGEVGDSFDPELYNAIAKIEDESLGENVVATVFQKGYKCKEKIIRYCMVQVAN